MPNADSPGRRGLSEKLRRFVDEMPRERQPILDFIAKIAADTPAGTETLDLGAGDAPYRELFAHAHYLSSDWGESVHPGARGVDVVAPADALPLADASVGLVVCTQVLEHVPEPSNVLDECFRVLQPGGRIALTVPLLWEVHEYPHDYYRYTEPGIRYLMQKAGFKELDIRARSDGFAAVAQLLDNLGWVMGDAPDGLTPQRVEAREMLAELARRIEDLGPLDVNYCMPLGYTATGVRP